MYVCAICVSKHRLQAGTPQCMNGLRYKCKRCHITVTYQWYPPVTQ